MYGGKDADVAARGQARGTRANGLAVSGARVGERHTGVQPSGEWHAAKLL